MQAGRANAAGVECVPLVSASANPQVSVAGRPFAQWTPDLRTRYASVFLTADFCFDRCLDGWKVEDLRAGFVRAHSPILLWIARPTGGRAFHVSKSMALDKIFEEVRAEMRAST